MPISKDKVRGLFLGCGIGDSLGVCCEGWTPERIKETYGRITTYQDPKGHKYHDGLRAGSTTDDTQLTISVAEALIESGSIDVDTQAVHHVKAFKIGTGGWGSTTREAIEKLANGIHWKESGIYSAGEKPKGFGNGVAMKAGPLGAYLASKPFDWKEIVDVLADFTAMTHPTSMAVSSCLAHAFAVFRCMVSEPDNFNIKTFIASVVNSSEIGKQYLPNTLNKDDITERLKLLESVTLDTKPEDISDVFGKGTYYVYNSLPFTYAFFVRNPRSIESLFDCVNSGGDCDSNASMLGSLLGALHGTSIFPKHLIDGLQEKDRIIKLADSFSERFGI